MQMYTFGPVLVGLLLNEWKTKCIRSFEKKKKNVIKYVKAGVPFCFHLSELDETPGTCSCSNVQ